MEGTRIAFPPATYDRNQASDCVERMVGPRTSSHGGKCLVRRKGSLDEIPHGRRIRGVGIVRMEDVGRVAAMFGDVGAEVHMRGSS